MGSDNKHQCPYPGCTERVERSMWGCRPHWYQLPEAIRSKIWRAYRSGTFAQHMDALEDADDWMDAHVTGN